MNWEEIIISALRNGHDLNESLKKAAEKAPGEIGLLLKDFPEKVFDISETLHLYPEVISLLYFHLFSREGEFFDEYPPEEQISIIKNSLDASLKASVISEALGENQLQATYLRRAADSLYTLGLSSEAERIYREALEIVRNCKKESELCNCMAMILNSLGNLYWTNHKFSEAESMYTEALNIYSTLAEEIPHALPHSATVMMNLGLLYKDMRKFEKAEKMYRKALQMRRELAEENSDIYADIAHTLNSLGSLYWTTHRFDDAETMYTEALKQYRGLAQENPDIYNPYLAVALSNLGVLYWNTQQLEKAEIYFAEALTIKRELAEKNPDIYADCAQILNNLGILYTTTQQLEKAEKFLTEALTIKRELAEENPEMYIEEISRTLTNLGIIYRRIHKFDKAEKVYTEALTIKRELAEKNPGVFPQIVTALTNLGALYNYTHKFSEAENMYTEALNVCRTLVEESPHIYAPYMAGILNNLGKFYKDTQRFDEAEKAYTEALKIRKTFSEKNPDVYTADYADTLNNLGILYKNLEKFSDAEENLKKSLEKYESLEKKNPAGYKPHVAMILTNLGNLYQKTGIFNNDTEALIQAETIYIKALKRYRTLAEENPDAFTGNVAGVLNNLGILYHDMNKFSQAEKVFREAFHMYKEMSSWFYAASVLRNISKITSDVKILDDSRKLLELAILFSNEKKYAYAQKGINEDSYRGLLDIDTDINPDYFGILEALRDPELLSIPWGQVLSKEERKSAYKDVRVQKMIVKRVLEGNVPCLTSDLVNFPENAIFIYVQYLPGNLLFFVAGPDGIQKIICERTFFTTGIKLLYLLKFQQITVGKSHFMDHVKKCEELTREWYTLLPQGVKKLIEEKSCIVFSPDSFCSYLPFEALQRDENSLCVEKTVVRATSLHQFVNMTERRPCLDSSLIFGNPWPERGKNTLVYSLPSGLNWYRIPFLEGACEEAATLAEKLPRSTLLLTCKATGENFLSEISNHSLIHFSGHGSMGRILFLSGPLKGFPPPFEPEEFSDLRKAGRVYNCEKISMMEEWHPITDMDLFDVKLMNGCVIFLNACETGQHKYAGGGYYQGLAAVFLKNGAHSVISSLIPIFDRQSKEFALHFYENLLNNYSVATSLKKARVWAQNAYRAHIYWLPYIHYGPPL
jgi:tetratricopeptide (TPR) repeat protein/CHAT domain-containing protein